MNYNHIPVMLNKAIEYLKIREDGIYIDGTLGRAGHTKAILKLLNEDGLLIGIDRDMEAIQKVKKELDDNKKLKLIHGNYVDIPEILQKLNINRVDGILFDLGVSSPQLDKAERGFSYSNEGPLDMRMNRSQDFNAEDIVNSYTKDKLTEIIKKYGEERWASRIAEFIVNARKHEKIKTTGKLVEIIKNAIPASARRTGGHPARRTFQALRIETNNELEQLKESIERAVNSLKSTGRICIISFHSLEDRIVKKTFKYLESDCVCPPDLPVCVCDKKQEVRIITKKPLRADKSEIETNPRSRSAKMRVAERVLN